MYIAILRHSFRPIKPNQSTRRLQPTHPSPPPQFPTLILPSQYAVHITTIFISQAEIFSVLFSQCDGWNKLFLFWGLALLARPWTLTCRSCDSTCYNSQGPSNHPAIWRRRRRSGFQRPPTPTCRVQWVHNNDGLNEKAPWMLSSGHYFLT